MNIVIFGGSGFIGSHVADILSDQGHHVTIFDLTVSKYLKSNQHMLQGDILDEKKVNASLKHCDFVYNFAGLSNIEVAHNSPIDTVKLNILGNCNILDACIKNNVKKFVYASSAYAGGNKGSFYKCSKQAAEMYVKEFHKKYGLQYVIVRYGSIYGMRANKDNWMYGVLNSAWEKSTIYHWGNGNEIREYVNVLDAAELSVEILDDKYLNKSILISGNIQYHIKDIFAIIQEIIDKPIKIYYKNETSDIHYKVSSCRYNEDNLYLDLIKLTSNKYRNINQGLLNCLIEIIRNKK